MKILKKILNLLESRYFNMVFYAFFAGFFGQQAFFYLHHGHIGWGLLLLAVAIYDVTQYFLWLTRRAVKVNIKIVKNKKESV